MKFEMLLKDGINIHTREKVDQWQKIFKITIYFEIWKTMTEAAVYRRNLIGILSLYNSCQIYDEFNLSISIVL